MEENKVEEVVNISMEEVSQETNGSTVETTPESIVEVVDTTVA